MRLRLIALILALSAVSWAQTATQSTPPQGAAPSEATTCPCCDKGASADAKEGHACCAHHAMASTEGKEPACCAGKDKATCCGGKDAKSCKRTGDDKTATACGSDKKCGKDCAEGCASKQDEKTSNSCCGTHCADHAAGQSSPGAGN
jgi:hypothetical protein